jgi:hypothetical protein
MCSSTSLRFFAAATINSKRSRTFTWPVNSLNIGGRSEISKAGSGSGGFISGCDDDFITPELKLRTTRIGIPGSTPVSGVGESVSLSRTSQSEAII